MGLHKKNPFSFLCVAGFHIRTQKVSTFNPVHVQCFLLFKLKALRIPQDIPNTGYLCML
jgi:hypothetical protein